MLLYLVREVVVVEVLYGCGYGFWVFFYFICCKCFG